jgi:hypothetical protein
MSTKISALPLSSSLSYNDYLPYVDISGPTTRRVLVSSLLSSSAPVTASYLTLTADATLQNERIMTTGTGLKGTDAGAGSTWTLAINDAVVATISGSKFSGPVTASVGISASFGVFGTSPSYATQGNVRLGINGSLWSQSSGGELPVFVVGNGGGLDVEFGSYAAGLTTLQGGSTYIDGSSQIVAKTAVFSIINHSTPAVKFVVNPISDIMTIGVSGSTVVSVDNLKATEDKSTMLTTTSAGDNSKILYQYISGTNGKTYGVDAVITAQSTTTTGSFYSKLSGHYYMVGGDIQVVGVPSTLLNSNNHSHLIAALTSSAGNIIVSGSQGASTESFRWGCFVRTQET